MIVFYLPPSFSGHFRSDRKEVQAFPNKDLAPSLGMTGSYSPRGALKDPEVLLSGRVFSALSHFLGRVLSASQPPFVGGYCLIACNKNTKMADGHHIVLAAINFQYLVFLLSHISPLAALAFIHRYCFVAYRSTHKWTPLQTQPKPLNL